MHYCLAVRESPIEGRSGSVVILAANAEAWRRIYNMMIPVAMRLGETPVSIPNTMVKTQAADGTMLETIWESRWLPEQFQKRSSRQQDAGGLQRHWHLPVIRGQNRKGSLLSDD